MFALPFIPIVPYFNLYYLTVANNMEDCDYGKLVHLIDVEGNQIQLWELKEGE